MKCTRCKFTGLPSEFPKSVKMKVLKTCADCLSKQAITRIQRANRDKENEGISQAELVTTENGRAPMLEWKVFISLLRDSSNHACELDAFVKEPSREPLMPCHERAIAVSRAVWDATGYRFKWDFRYLSTVKLISESYHSCNEGTHIFYCAQSEGEETKNKKCDERKNQRARMKMERFKCHGWLRILANEKETQMVKVRFTHTIPHEEYTDISIPDEIAKIIDDMKSSSAAKVGILPTYQRHTLTLRYRSGVALWKCFRKQI
jgi:hypothetical protein